MNAAPNNNFFLDGEDDTGVRKRIRKVLKLAGEKGINYFDTTIESHHEDDALRAVHALLYFRYHKVDEEDFREFITPERIASKSNLYGLHRIRGQNYNADKQQAIMDFYLVGVGATAQAMGGKKTFRNTTQRQRHELWESIFDSNELRMAKASLVGLTGSVPVEDIYSYNSATHIKWQSFIRTTFVLTADLTLKYRFMVDDDKKYECFKKWCAIPFLEEIEALELGDEKDIPVRSTGPYDQGKARRVTKADLDFGDPNVLVSQFVLPTNAL